MSSAENNKKRIFDSLVIMVLGLVLMYLTYTYVYSQLISGSENDIFDHVYVIISLFRVSKLQGWMQAPHCLWHLLVYALFAILQIPLNAAACYVSCLFALFYYLVIIWFLKKLADRELLALSAPVYGTIAFGLCIVSPFYLYFLDCGKRYMGVFSPNPIHNPTQMALRGFILLIFCLAMDLIAYAGDPAYIPVFFKVNEHPGKSYIALALLLLVSTATKPTFAEMFIPTVAFYMLGVLIYRLVKKQDPDLYFRHCLRMFFSALPALFYIALQSLVFFVMGGSYNSDGGVVITQWLEVWSGFSGNIPIAVLLAMAFPIYMILIDSKYFTGHLWGRISILGYGIAFLEAALLGENGDRSNHANFLWPLMSAMQLLWIVSTARLLVLSKTYETATTVKRVLLLIGWGLFILQVCSGISLYHAMLNGLGNY